MKKRIVYLILTLCLVLSVLALASCGKRGKTPGTGDQTTASTTDRWEILAPTVRGIPESDRTLRISYSVKKSAEKASKNDVYLKGPDNVDDGSIPHIQVSIYERNRTANELLGTTVEYSSSDNTYGEQAAPIIRVIQANDPNAPDLFVNMIYDLNFALLNGVFKDVWSIPHSFFDFSTAGWLKAWMENMSFTGDRAYILGSDYFLDVFRSISLLPFNMTLMDQNAAKLTAAIRGEGETLGAGEKLSPYFFDLVDEGEWTWDVLGKLCEAIFVDQGDQKDQDDINDILGIIADTFGGINAASFIYSCGEELTEAYKIEDPNSPYYGKQWIKYPDDSTGLNLIFDKVKAVFDGKGSLSTSATFSGNTPENPGSAYHHIKFAKSELLFAGVCLLGALEDDEFQQMTDIYSVVPLPKVNAEKSYNTIIVNQADAGAINVHASRNKSRVLSAYLQYSTEHSIAIREEFLQIVTKYQTTDYDQGTDRMLDIIYDSILYGRDKTVEDMICEGNELRKQRWHSLLKDDSFGGGSSYIVSEYQSLREAKQSRLDECMKTWYNLPKVEQ